MNKKLILIVFIVLSCNSIKQNNIPIIKLEVDSLNLGDIKIGDSVIVGVKVFNLGNDTLKIINIGVSCGCTAASINKKAILPGDSGTLSLNYSNIKSNDSGHILKSIVLRNNSKETFKILRIIANVYK